MSNDERWRRLYDSLKPTILDLQNRLAQAHSIILTLEEEKKQWVRDKVRQQSIIQEALTRANAQSNSYLEENARLREEIKRLRDGNFNRLADENHKHPEG